MPELAAATVAPSLRTDRRLRMSVGESALGLALGDFLKRLDSYLVADLVPDPGWFSQQLGAGLVVPNLQAPLPGVSIFGARILLIT